MSVFYFFYLLSCAVKLRRSRRRYQARTDKNGCTLDIVRCLSYENLSDTAAYLNEGLSFNRDVNLLAAAYSHYKYGKSETYKIILKNSYSSFYSFNMSLVPIFSI